MVRGLGTTELCQGVDWTLTSRKLPTANPELMDWIPSRSALGGWIPLLNSVFAENQGRYLDSIARATKPPTLSGSIAKSGFRP